MNDHYAEAESQIRFIRKSPNLSSAQAQVFAALAQVHATLALADQCNAKPPESQNRALMSGKWSHQCATPPIWWARLRRSQIGREWTCTNCGQVWTFTNVRFPYGLPGAPLIKEWRNQK